MVQAKDNTNVCGSYIHGLFDEGNLADAIVRALAKKKGVQLDDAAFMDYKSFKNREYDKLAETLRLYLNMEEIYGMLTEAHLE